MYSVDLDESPQELALRLNATEAKNQADEIAVMINNGVYHALTTHGYIAFRVDSFACDLLLERTHPALLARASEWMYSRGHDLHRLYKMSRGLYSGLDALLGFVVPIYFHGEVIDASFPIVRIALPDAHHPPPTNQTIGVINPYFNHITGQLDYPMQIAPTEQALYNQGSSNTEEMETGPAPTCGPIIISRSSSDTSGQLPEFKVPVGRAPRSRRESTASGSSNSDRLSALEMLANVCGSRHRSSSLPPNVDAADASRRSACCLPRIRGVGSMRELRTVERDAQMTCNRPPELQATIRMIERASSLSTLEALRSMFERTHAQNVYRPEDYQTVELAYRSRANFLSRMEH